MNDKDIAILVLGCLLSASITALLFQTHRYSELHDWATRQAPPATEQ